jgi:membrane protease YdiL (CAAX protease family)
VAYEPQEEIMMNRFDSSVSLAGLWSGANRKPTLILLLTPVLLTVFKYYGSKEFYLENIQNVLQAGNADWAAALYAFASSFVLFGLVPLIIIRFVFHESLSEYGVRLGDWSFGWKALLVLGVVYAVSAYPSSKMPDFLAEYPIFRGAGQSSETFLLHALSYLFFYAGWEMYFRGFMQFGLRSSLGDWNAILVQILASCLVHIGKPAGETFSSILGGLIWGILAFRTRSVLYGIATHWILGVSLDAFIVFFSS